MRLVCTHPTLIAVTQARSELERQGIQCLVRNEYAAGAIGGLSPIDAWPELWVLEDHDWERATRALEKMRTDSQGPDWRCAQCGITNTGTGGFCVIASKGGAPAHPSWYLNLEANSKVHIQVATEHFDAVARVAGGEERERLWKLMVDYYAPYTDYQAATQRQIPVVVLDPA